MKTYSKTHKSKKAADAHAKKIKARGGSVKYKSVEIGYELTYSFPDKRKLGEKRKPKFKVGDIVAHTKFKTIGIVRIKDERGETKTDADGNVETRLLEYYDPEIHKKREGYTIAPSTKKDADFQKIYLPF